MNIVAVFVFILVFFPFSVQAGGQCPPAVLKAFATANHGYQTECKVIPSGTNFGWKTDKKSGYKSYHQALQVAIDAVAIEGPFEGRLFTIKDDPDGGKTPVFRKIVSE